MEIVEVETVRVAAFPNLTYVLVHTDEGVTGLGETFYGAEAVEAHLHAIAAPALLGEDARRIEYLGRQLTGYVGYAGTGVETRARSAVDVALWDILGQTTGQPVYNLLGGATNESLPIYNTCAGPEYVNSARGQAVDNWGVKPGEFEDLFASIHHPGELARELRDMGVLGMKVWPFDEYAERSRGHYISVAELSEATAKLAAIRDAVGHDLEIMVELHALWDVPSARCILRALEPFEPMWVEDPVRADMINGLSKLAHETPLRIAGAETVGGLSGFQQLLTTGALGVVTVDVTWSGGLTVARNVAALADAHGIPVAPHDCTGPVALAACVHLATASPNTLVQETVRAGYLGWYSGIVEGGPVFDRGRVRATSEPGLGIRLASGLRDRSGTTTRSTKLDA